MIFDNEVRGCMSGELDDDEIGLALEYFTLGGFHRRVLDSERRQFIKWMEARKQNTPVVYRPPTDEQLSFLDELECTL